MLVREGQKPGESDEAFLKREAEHMRIRKENNDRLARIRAMVEKRFGKPK